MSNKLFIITGARDGDGKSTLAVNIACHFAQLRRQPVILIDADPLCRGELAQMAGTGSSLTAAQLLDQLASKQISVPMLRGRVPANRLGIGVLAAGNHPKELQNITAEQWGFFLEGFLQNYDVVLDLDVHHPFRTSSFDLADAVLWPFIPQPLSVRATLRELDLLQTQKFNFHQFQFLLNQADQPFGMPIDNAIQAFERMAIDISDQIPYDEDILRSASQGKPAVNEQSRSPYFSKINEIATKLHELKATPKARTANVSKSPLGAPSTQTTAASKNVVDAMAEQKRKQWNLMKQQLHRDLVEELNIRRIDLDTKGDPVRERQLRTNVESTVNALIGRDKELTLSREERERLVKELVDEALGLGPLEELLADPTVTEVMVNRFDQVYIERKGKIVLSDKRFIDNNHIVQVVRRIIAPLGRRIDESVPMVDARLKDGSRVNAIIPPLAVSGPTITIRRFPEKAFSSDDLVKISAINQGMIDFLRICVLLKKNMVISGGTGTGKTTILNMLSSFIPNDDRIVTVEDTAELRLQQEHVVRLEARPANIEGQGAVPIRDLVKNCLRMRPDRIVVGECRGGEALDMLQAMNTGHEGSLTTIHANTPRDCFTRMETLCLMAGMDLPVWALREQIRSAVHIVVQLTRLQDGSRKVTCITEVTGRSDEQIVSHDLFRFVQDGVDAQGKVFGHHEATGEKPLFLNEMKAKGVDLDVKIFEPKAA